MTLSRLHPCCFDSNENETAYQSHNMMILLLNTGSRVVSATNFCFSATIGNKLSKLVNLSPSLGDSNPNLSQSSPNEHSIRRLGLIRCAEQARNKEKERHAKHPKRFIHHQTIVDGMPVHHQKYAEPLCGVDMFEPVSGHLTAFTL